MKRWLVLCLILFLILIPLRIFGEELWEGNAARIRRGEFIEEGLFAASNSFTQDTVIEVENLRTGKSVNVTVVKRMGDQANLFLLLSAQASEILDIDQGDVERVRVKVVHDFGSDLLAKSEEPRVSRDPDVNPNIGLPPLTETRKAEGKDAGAKIEKPVAEQKATSQPEEKALEKDLLTEKATRTPQKNLYKMPREGEVIVSTAVSPPKETTSPTVRIAAEEPRISVETVEGAGEKALPDRPVVEEEAPRKAREMVLIPDRLQEPAIHEFVRASEEEGPVATLEPPPYEREKALVYRLSDPRPPEEAAFEIAEGKPEATDEPPKAGAIEERIFVTKDPVPPEEAVEAIAYTSPVPPKREEGYHAALMPADPAVAEQRGEGEPLIASEPPQPEKTPILAFAPSEPLPPEEVVPGEGEKPTVITKAVSAAEAERPVLRHGEPLPPEKPVEEKEKTTVTAGKEEPAREIPPRDTRSESEKLATLKLELKGDPTSGRMFYIQLGAYSDEIVARDLEAAYSKSYPIEILSSRSGTRGLYRVMVGPLNKDESGTVLYWFQVRGFKDAFVRSVN